MFAYYLVLLAFAIMVALICTALYYVSEGKDKLVLWLSKVKCFFLYSIPAEIKMAIDDIKSDTFKSIVFTIVIFLILRYIFYSGGHGYDDGGLHVGHPYIDD